MFVRGLCVILCVWVSVELVSAQLNPAGCNLSQVPVQKNFDINKYVGRWNELLWVAPVEEAAYDSTDYYWLLHNATDGGVVHGYQTGRDPISGRCFGARIMLNQTDTPGVLLLTTPVNKYITRYYIMDTDYDTYANAYGCYLYSNDGQTCYMGRAWLWARGSSLPADVLQKARQSWETLCLDLNNLLKVTPVTGHDCPVRG